MLANYAAYGVVVQQTAQPGGADVTHDEVYNGDVGYVTGVEPDGGELTAIFDGRSVT